MVEIVKAINQVEPLLVKDVPLSLLADLIPVIENCLANNHTRKDIAIICRDLNRNDLNINESCDCLQQESKLPKKT